MCPSLIPTALGWVPLKMGRGPGARRGRDLRFLGDLGTQASQHVPSGFIHDSARLSGSRGRAKVAKTSARYWPVAIRSPPTGSTPQAVHRWEMSRKAHKVSPSSSE